MSSISSALQECPDRLSVVKASWTLTSDGRTVAGGSNDDERSGAWDNDSISRLLGTFHSANGRRYVLDVDVLEDGSSLALGKSATESGSSPNVLRGRYGRRSRHVSYRARAGVNRRDFNW
jgi:hypothetical protein